jgi:anti-sigma factor RsiW
VRGKLSDQDLTDYALNELGPEERLYVESMLAVSEECREDVYKTIDLGLLIEEAFEREEGKVVAVELTDEQRLKLLDVHVPNRFLRRSVALLAAAAAVTLAFVSKDAWLPKSAAVRVAQVSDRMTTSVKDVMSAAEGEDFVSQLASFRKLTEDPAKWLPSQPPGGAAVFGPPASMFNVEISPRGGLEFSQ